MRLFLDRPTLLLVGCFFAIACSSRTAPILNYPDVSIAVLSGRAMASTDVRDAIVMAANRKGWTTRDLEPTLIEATLQSRQHRAVVTIPYTATSYGINYKDSAKLRHEKDRIHSNYNRWIKNLKRQIDRQLHLIGERRAQSR